MINLKASFSPFGNFYNRVNNRQNNQNPSFGLQTSYLSDPVTEDTLKNVDPFIAEYIEIQKNKFPLESVFRDRAGITSIVGEPVDAEKSTEILFKIAKKARNMQEFETIITTVGQKLKDNEEDLRKKIGVTELGAQIEYKNAERVRDMRDILKAELVKLEKDIEKNPIPDDKEPAQICSIKNMMQPGSGSEKGDGFIEEDFDFDIKPTHPGNRTIN